jgi:hypothetical protein
LAIGADQQPGSAGGRQRKSPTGGAAYGMAKYAHVPFADTPCTGPRSVTARPGAAATDDGQALPSLPPSLSDELTAEWVQPAETRRSKQIIRMAEEREQSTCRRESRDSPVGSSFFELE